MLRSQLIRHANRAIRASQAPIAARTVPLISHRQIHINLPLQRDDKKEEEHEGSFARTDPTVEVEYPEEGDLPSSTPVQGRGGLHFKRTLASFSLEGKVGVVTGGARGLGLVMSQAMVISGADVAIVDLNSMSISTAYSLSLNAYRGGGG
jgi:D-arabinitol 2-dehydrogenase